MDPPPVIVTIRDNGDYIRVLLIVPLLQGGGSSQHRGLNTQVSSTVLGVPIIRIRIS